MAVLGMPTAPWRDRLGLWIESSIPRNFIIALIVINAALLGLQTSETVVAAVGDWMRLANTLIVAVFVVEILIKLIAWGPRFFRNGWNVFDFLIVAVSLVPDSAGLSVLRALRILRVLRLLSTVGHLRVVTESLLKAIPGIGWIGLLLLIVFYVFGVMGTELFGDAFPRQFGNVGASMYSLFQIMTLEGWSEDIARPVMDVYPYAWVYFIVFILMSSFTVLNLFIGIIVNSMQELHWTEEEAKQSEREEKARLERERMLRLIEELHAKVDRMERR
ncbi:ion transporter [Natronospira bacteriovora]|uniref:Ion transporter n=1 Tax=Natronospira bacteriovora TaxID=3069753 RepID=A0ABU0W8Y8_9GAMM|nr:ion transporter [Natronospira sp. AB-CW4]MDQ2070497.1 ion transporter [Natronospira sp. AB-CW4]